MKQGKSYVVLLPSIGHTIAVCLKRNLLIDANIKYPYAVSYAPLPPNDPKLFKAICGTYNALLNIDHREKMASTF